MRQLVLDTEIYQNYFLLAFKDLATGKSKGYELYDGSDPFPVDEVMRLMEGCETISFNGLKFDLPLITLACKGWDAKGLKMIANKIIVDEETVWNLERQFNFKTMKYPDIKHIDLMEVKVGDGSLKILGGRMHSKRMQDLPIEPEALIRPEERVTLREYCINDLDTTIDLFNALQGPLQMRRDMMEAYPIGLSFMSLSEGQIAEAIIKHQAEKELGTRIKKQSIGTGFTVGYEPAPWLKFKTPLLQDVFNKIVSAEFEVQPTGKIVIPKEILDLDITIGDSSYQIGIGGLHSTESNRSVFSDSDHLLQDHDAASLYPTLMVLCNIAPMAYQGKFFDIFKSILAQRLEAKARGDKVLSEKLKLLLNSSFGRTGSKYSTFYDPEGMLRVTLTGQLTLLMLIEMFELCGINVVSANTDGVTCRINKSKLEVSEKILRAFEKHTGLTMETVEYTSLHNASVNAYFAIKPDGSVKLKGPYAKPGLQKNPQNYICTIAVSEFLSKGTPISDTIRNHKDIRDFVTVRTVTGGAVKDGEFLGKAVRFYFAKGETGIIQYRKNGNKVPMSLGAKPCMTLPEELPDDIDYDKYERLAKKILIEIGMLPKPPNLPRKNSKEWKQLLHEGKIEESEEEGKYQWVED